MEKSLHQISVEISNQLQRINGLQNDAVFNALLASQSVDPSIVYLYLKATGIADADKFRTRWQESNQSATIKTNDEMFFPAFLEPDLPDLQNFPDYSFTVTFGFTLAKPYLSKNDNDFYILENPIQRDKAFQVPMMRPSGWKGALRAALYQSGYDSPDLWQRLFGEANDNEAGIAGRLHIYPSFFKKTGLEILNPHERKTKAGKSPIVLESVPEGSQSTFSLLYFPFDLIGANPEEHEALVAEDFKAIMLGLHAMFTLYGFGAKTSSGHGMAKDDLRECIIQAKLPGVPQILTIETSSFSDLSRLDWVSLSSLNQEG